MTQTTHQVKLAINPLENAALSIGKMRIAPEEFFQAVTELSTEINFQSQAIKKGDSSKIEELLYAQSLTLDAAFYKFLAMATTATNQPSLLAERFELIASLVAIALKAQDQSRKTLVALTEMKNPKRSTTFIKNYVDKQLNQMNVEPSQHPDQIQLQEDKRAALDIRSEREAASANTAVEALAFQQRPKKRSWKKDK